MAPADTLPPSVVCAVTGAPLPQAQALRFVVAPDGQLTPDLAGKLPGDGLFVAANPTAVAALAVQHGAGLAGDDGAGLVALVTDLLVRRASDRLGLARKAGQIVLGFGKVEAALAGGKADLLLAAKDGAVHGRKTLAAKARAADVPVVDLFTTAQLSVAMGRDNVIHAAVTERIWAEQVKFEAERLQAFLGVQGQ